MNELDIFSTAVELKTPEARDQYLDQACGDNPSLRQRIVSLLRSSNEAGSFIESPAQDFRTLIAIDRPIAEQPGTVIGPYKLLQQIGEGGMGVVFMAEQSEPIERTVALKIIKPGMDSRQVIARFEAERQALAMMDHPNIARVLDAGQTETGRPYFVMELVKGLPITKYCDEKRLSLRQRLELFLPVCQAVQHAHQKGIIHRDLKPTNVLVAEYDSHAIPKVIDFGVAKATAQKLTERTMFTEFGQVIGTVEYMSPEQAKFNQLDVDTRSDIYSLGVLLYELFTGSTPFDRERLRTAAFDEVLRIIREEEPQKPSTRLNTSDTLPSIAANRQTEPARLNKDISGELDWIVMTCLEKDRDRRYQTANGLALDIERHLEDRPVHACPPSAAYRFRKFARRNKAALLLASASVVALLTLVGGLAYSNYVIKAERNEKASALIAKEQALALADAHEKRARNNFRRANVAIRELMTGMVERAGEASPSLRKRFSEEATKYFEALIKDEGLDPELRYESAVGYRSLSMLSTAWTNFEQAKSNGLRGIAILEQLVSEYPNNKLYQQQLGYAHSRFGQSLLQFQKQSDADSHLDRALELYERLMAEEPTSFDYAWELSEAYRVASTIDSLRGRHEDAERNYRSSVALYVGIIEGRIGPDPYPAAHKDGSAYLTLALTHHARAKALTDLGRYSEAEAVLRDRAKFADIARKEFPDIAAHYNTAADSYLRLHTNLIKQNRAPESEVAYQHAVDVYLALTSINPQIAEGWIGLGTCYAKKSDFAKAEQCFRRALEREPAAPTAFVQLGQSLIAQKKYEEADSIWPAGGAKQIVDTNLLNSFAWNIAVDPDVDPRYAKRAAETPQRATELAAENGAFWNTLGVAKYRAGDYEGAIAALEKSMALRNGGDAFDLFFLAMAQWKLEKKAESRKSFDKALEWMHTNSQLDEELISFRAEAANVLGVDTPTISQSTNPLPTDSSPSK